MRTLIVKTNKFMKTNKIVLVKIISIKGIQESN